MVCRYSESPPPPPRPLRFPIASISSINIMVGFSVSLASKKVFLTLSAPTPTYLLINEEPERWIKFAFASWATALANKVFPVPGGPSNKIPRGIFAPILM